MGTYHDVEGFCAMVAQNRSSFNAAGTVQFAAYAVRQACRTPPGVHARRKLQIRPKPNPAGHGRLKASVSNAYASTGPRNHGLVCEHRPARPAMANCPADKAQGLVPVCFAQSGVVFGALIARADVESRRHDVQHACERPGISRENEAEKECVLY